MGVAHHRVLRSPDFPPARPRKRRTAGGHPIHSEPVKRYLVASGTGRGERVAGGGWWVAGRWNWDLGFQIFEASRRGAPSPIHPPPTTHHPPLHHPPLTTRFPCHVSRRSNSAWMAAPPAVLLAHHAGPIRNCGGASPLSRSITTLVRRQEFQEIDDALDVLAECGKPHFAPANHVGQSRAVYGI